MTGVRWPTAGSVASAGAGSWAALSVLDVFGVGIGPSSSHVVGPMRAARHFALRLDDSRRHDVANVVVTLYGSLGATGEQHGTIGAVIAGLAGERPESTSAEVVARLVASHREHGSIALAMGADPDPGLGPAATLTVRFEGRSCLPRHPNALELAARTGDGRVVSKHVYYSVGGGAVVDERGVPLGARRWSPVEGGWFGSAAELIALTEERECSVSDVVLVMESGFRREWETRAELRMIVGVMRQCVERGLRTEGRLPGSLAVRRRAPGLHDRFLTGPGTESDLVSAAAIAVNEENAAGRRVVTAPTNGAAGVVPAVLEHVARFVPGADDETLVRYLLTAGAFGVLCKSGGSVSGAEVGCQGEVGSAAAMAAAGLTEVLGGSPRQVENAAEIAMEHHLGMTCDPIGGYVQIPCIERNAIGAVKAIASARLAMGADGTHRVPFDDVLRTMRATGADMSDKYRETARGGLAVNVTLC